jgi:FMN reductase [NAD(P)H]
MTNSTINSMLNHRSIRSYLDKKISETDINSIIEATRVAPTSINAQPLSVLSIEDKELRKKVADLSWGQQHIIDCSHFLVFIMDFNKSDIACRKQNTELKIQESIESIMAGSVDIGIALGSAIVASESLGLGTCCIGAVRNSPEEMAKVLNLPKNTFAVVGLCIGYINTSVPSATKPKMPVEGFLMKNIYDNSIVQENIIKYDNIMQTYFKERGEGDDKSWSGTVAKFFNNIYYPNVYPTLIKQGFNTNK